MLWPRSRASTSETTGGRRVVGLRTATLASSSALPRSRALSVALASVAIDSYLTLFNFRLRTSRTQMTPQGTLQHLRQCTNFRRHYIGVQQCLVRGWIVIGGVDEKLSRFASFPCLFVVGQLGYVRSVATALYRYCQAIHRTDRKATGKGDVADFVPPLDRTARQSPRASDPDEADKDSPVGLLLLQLSCGVAVANFQAPTSPTRAGSLARCSPEATTLTLLAEGSGFARRTRDASAAATAQARATDSSRLAEQIARASNQAIVTAAKQEYEEKVSLIRQHCSKEAKSVSLGSNPTPRHLDALMADYTLVRHRLTRS